MKIVSLNTWAGVVLEPLLNFFTLHQDVDVFCLQEIYSDAEEKAERHPNLIEKLDLFEQIENKLKDTHVGYFRPAYKDYYGIAIFVKKSLKIVEEGDLCIYENNDPEGRGRHSRNLQYVRTFLNDKPIVISHVHGLWNGMGKGDTDDRIEQSKRIKTFIDIQNMPVVLIGDFNLNPDTQSISIIEKGMRNLIKEYNVTSTRTSYYAKEGKFADYAFVTPGVDVKDFAVLPDEVSDHAALSLEIE